MKRLVIALFLFANCSAVFSAEEQWTEGFGQGNLEYFIDKQDFRLLINCPTQNGSAEAQSSISLSNAIDDYEIAQFTVTVSGITYDAPFSTDSRVGDNNFIAFLEGLRKGDAVVKFGNKTIIFPKSNASKIVPIFGEKNFSCNLSA